MYDDDNGLIVDNDFGDDFEDYYKEDFYEEDNKKDQEKKKESQKHDDDIFNKS